MASIFTKLWGSFNFVGAVIVASALVGNKLPRKHGYWPRMILLSIVIFLISFAFEELVNALSLSVYVRQTFRTLNCAFVFLSTLGLLKFSCTCSIWQALFCVTTGYCMEHLSQRLYSVLTIFISSLTVFPLAAIAVIAMRLLVYILFYRWIIHKMDLSHIETDSKFQIIAALIIVTFAIFISSYSGIAAVGVQSTLLHLMLYLYSMVLCVLGLFVELYQVSYQRMKSERDILQQLIYQEAEQYRREKDAVDVIKIKCHDLKHQLHILEEKYGTETMKDLRQAVEGYDSFFRTGNVALDTVLAMKNYNCIHKNIQLTCMADGEKLKMLSEADLYSLFGNILDNAIEAVEKLPIQRRIISLNIFLKNRFIFIHCENYFDAMPEFVEGVPQTTKENKNYHGYGSHSLRLMAEKYGGTCTFRMEGSVFHTDIVLPER